MKKIKNLLKSAFDKLHKRFYNEKIDNAFIKIRDKVSAGYKKFDAFFSEGGYFRAIMTIIVVAFILNFIVEALSRSSIIEPAVYLFSHPISYLCNMLIILVTLSTGMFSKKRFFSIFSWSVFWIALGFVNHTILANRVTPFNATDFLMVKAGVQIADKYYSGTKIFMTILTVVIIVAIIGLVWLKGPKLKKKLNYVKSAIAMGSIILAAVLGLKIATSTGAMATVFANLPSAYEDYGFPYCLGTSIFSTGVSKPDNYEEKIGEIVEAASAKAEKDYTADATPNIIVIQLESFFNVNDLIGYEFSENPIPTFTSLCDNFASGYVRVPSIGAGTSNTEFEMLTGLNLDDFGPGEIPYKTIMLKKVCESYAYDLKNYNYSTHALHNNDATFYQRHTVYPNLGFDTFTSMEYMNITQWTYKNWAKDYILTDSIMDCINSTENQDFVFTVSVQGHGSYPSEEVLENPAVRVTKQPEGVEGYSMEYYVNQIHEMDEFISQLIDAINEKGEDTILVLYGDHLPNINLEDDDLTYGDALYTPYVVWNNFGLQMEDNVNVEAWQLLSNVMKSIGVNAGVINNYHQTYNGNVSENEYLSGLKNLAYDILYGDQNAFGGTLPYETTNMHFGIRPISITGTRTATSDDVNAFIERLKAKDPTKDYNSKYEEMIANPSNYTVVEGENFTNYSLVFIGDDYQGTYFVNPNTIFFKTEEGLEAGTQIKVGQVGDDKYLLSETESYTIQ